jgi:hypothetical protein
MDRAHVVVVALLALGALPLAVFAEPTVTVTPASGPIGTRFRTEASGLPPGSGVVAVVRDPNGVEHSGPALGAVPADGTFRPSDTWDSRPGEPLGEYVSIIKSLDGNTVFASATFTVTGPAGPAAGAGPQELPRSGDLGPRSLPTALLTVLGLGLIGAGYRLGRRGRR